MQICKQCAGVYLATMSTRSPTEFGRNLCYKCNIMTDNISQWLQHTSSLTCSTKVYILPEGGWAGEQISVHFQIMIQFCFHTHVFNVYSTYNYWTENIKKTALILQWQYIWEVQMYTHLYMYWCRLYHWLVLWEWISHHNSMRCEM